MIGGYGRGRRRRRTYYATGVPGYGRGGCAWRDVELLPRSPAYGAAAPGLARDEELRMLEEEEETLEQELDDLKQELGRLRDEMKREVKE